MDNTARVIETTADTMEKNPNFHAIILAKDNSIDNMNVLQRAIKRFGDIIVSLFGLICLSPVFLIIAIKQKLSSKGPVFFTQERIGKHGKPFKIIKFRTMVVDAEEDGPALAKDGDDRLTKFGKFSTGISVLLNVESICNFWQLFQQYSHGIFPMIQDPDQDDTLHFVAVFI